VQTDRLRQIAAAAILAQIFTAYVLVLRAATPPTEAEWARVISPAFLVTAHCAAHVLIPALFAAR